MEAVWITLYIIAGFIGAVLLRLYGHQQGTKAAKEGELVVILFWPIGALVYIMHWLFAGETGVLPRAITWIVDYIQFQKDRPKAPPRVRPDPPEPDVKSQLKQNELS